MRGGHTWVGASAARIAAAVQYGDASATEVIVDHLDHARLADRVLDALGVLRAGAAVAEAEQVDAADEWFEPDLPLAGVPVIVAEDTPIAGVADGRRGVARTDHEIVRRLRGAGAVVLGVGRQSDQAGPRRGRHRAGKHEENGGHWRGPTIRNPWRADRTPGGAAAGPAAAVAAGVVPLAHAMHGLGTSAASCGLFGLRPGLEAEAVLAMHSAEHGVIATTVADAALGHAVVSGWWPEAANQRRRLRVAASVGSPLPLLGPDRAARIAVRRAARLLIGLDHDVVAGDPEYPTRLVLAARQRQVDAGLRIDWRTTCERWFGRHGFDLLLLPALAGPPPAAVPNSGDWLGNPLIGMRLTAFTTPWSLAGLPAVTVPMGTRPDGLPASVQLVGPPRSEALLCAVAAQFERIAPWRRHAPGWPRPVRPFGTVMARSGHDRTRASNEAGDPGGRAGGPEGARRSGPHDATGAEPSAHGRARWSRLAQV